ncbi:hypothetical protein HK101_006699 [Irineochytrium annulatum]|nr:hypothetical protein HK101_006699 [Irineochytrium annulatum]
MGETRRNVEPKLFRIMDLRVIHDAVPDAVLVVVSLLIVSAAETGFHRLLAAAAVAVLLIVKSHLTSPSPFSSEHKGDHLPLTESTARRKSPDAGTARNLLRPRKGVAAAGVMTVACLVLSFLLLLGGPSLQSDDTLAVDGSASSTRTPTSAQKMRDEVDIVMAYYEEDLNELSWTIRSIASVPSIGVVFDTLGVKPHQLLSKVVPGLPADVMAAVRSSVRTRTIIYNKNDNVSATVIGETSGADMVYNLPNLGREGATFLHHIVQHYDDLSRWTLFTQAAPATVEALVERLAMLKTDTAFMALRHYVPCGCDGCFAPLPRVRELWSLARKSWCPDEGFGATMNGQFLVSATRIRKQPRSFYQFLLDALNSDMSHPIHHNASLSWINDTASNPVFGHAVERSWSFIFGCSDLSMVDRCPWAGSLMCQCREDASTGENLPLDDPPPMPVVEKEEVEEEDENDGWMVEMEKGGWMEDVEGWRDGKEENREDITQDTLKGDAPVLAVEEDRPDEVEEDDAPKDDAPKGDAFRHAPGVGSIAVVEKDSFKGDALVQTSKDEKERGDTVKETGPGAGVVFGPDADLDTEANRPLSETAPSLTNGNRLASVHAFLCISTSMITTLRHRRELGLIAVLVVLAFLSCYILGGSLRSPAEDEDVVASLAASEDVPASTDGRPAAGNETAPTTRDVVDLVISYYSEHLPTLAWTLATIRAVPTLTSLTSLGHRAIIYNKGPSDSSLISSSVLPDLVLDLPNLGREGATYLHHIVENYDDLARWTLFTQAEPATTDGLVNRLSTLQADTAFLALRHYDLCGCAYCYSPFPRLAEVWTLTKKELCPSKGFAATLNGQFLVSASRIRKHPKSYYKYLLDLITSDMTHFIHDNASLDWIRDEPSNPVFGHVMERSWSFVFGCADLAMIERCTWDHGNNMCQCREDASTGENLPLDDAHPKTAEEDWPALAVQAPQIIMMNPEGELAGNNAGINHDVSA